MLNDLVLYRGDVAKVIAITANGEVSLFVDGHIVARFVYAEELSPITLTPEILEKNGWKLISKTRYKLECSWGTGAVEEYADIHIYVGKDHSNVWRWDFPILNIHLYRGDIELTKFRYVHELQHALKICGIKKEIVL